ncbi:MAG TPA: sulfotransferase [Candidatus Limnocylindria bacterium]|jgi:hypothetical protein
MKPDFLVIGAAKSGTTALWSFLRQHPQVFMPAVKEPQYFAFEEGAVPRFAGPGATIGRAITTWDAYEALFAAAGPDARAVGEASNLYLYVPEASERIRARLPEARLVAVLRHPADRAFSSYLHLKRQGREPAPDFGTALDLEAARIADGWGFLWRYREMGFYGVQLQRYVDRFPRGQLLVHLYDELVADPLAVLGRTYGFLGVDTMFAPDLSARPNRGGVPRRGWRGALLSRSSPLRRLVAAATPRSLRERAREAADRRVLVRERLDPAVRRRLTEEFSSDIEQLARILDRDLSAWLA